MNHLFIGTSGYSYPYWKGKFYPKEVPMTKCLNYYSGQFNALELNNTFYRFPTVKGDQDQGEAQFQKHWAQPESRPVNRFLAAQRPPT